MLRDYEKVMKAASDPTRARILKMLEGGEMCVCQIIAVLGISQSTVSQHLSLLKGAGLVRERRARKFVYYSIEPEHPSELARAFLAGLRRWMKDDPTVARDLQLAAVARRQVRSMGALLCPTACSTRGGKTSSKGKAKGKRGVSGA
jgi:ArsR family transcriptional regulator, arsenate/arsenite/antimonite-responsive transcriptional repressor